VALVRSNVSEERIAFIIKVKRIKVLGALAVARHISDDGIFIFGKNFRPLSLNP
jgi:hypothetical protein